MAMTATELRRDVYNILDEVIETGVPAEIERKGKHLKIIVIEKPSKFDRIKPIKDLIIGDPEDLNNLDWSDEWKYNE